MTVNILRNFCSRPVTRPYPAVPKEPFKGTRGRIEFQAQNCEFCGECERACPTGAMFLDARWERPDASEPTWYRVFDPCSCIFCEACIEACAYKALILGGQYGPPVIRKELDFGRVEYL